MTDLSVYDPLAARKCPPAVSNPLSLGLEYDSVNVYLRDNALEVYVWEMTCLGPLLMEWAPLHVLDGGADGGEDGHFAVAAIR